MRYVQDCYGSVGGVEIDYIVFNVGLWDILRLSNEDRCLISKDEYRENLKRIINRIRHFWPDASLIFCLTTSVIEPCYIEEITPFGGVNVAERRNGDIVEYNNIARELLETYYPEICICDLYSISVNAPECSRSDSIHFDTEYGAKMLGDEIIKTIERIDGGQSVGIDNLDSYDVIIAWGAGRDFKVYYRNQFRIDTLVDKDEKNTERSLKEKLSLLLIKNLFEIKGRCLLCHLRFIIMRFVRRSRSYFRIRILSH